MLLRHRARSNLNAEAIDHDARRQGIGELYNLAGGISDCINLARR
jgi:hypothetical protein